MKTIEQYRDQVFEHCQKLFDLGMDEQGQCTALAYSQRLCARTDYIAQQMQAAGMQVEYDAAANLIGVYPGSKSQKRIMITSHIDTVVNAGRYDGVLGVVLGLVYAQYLFDNQIQREHAIELRVCMGEESPGITATFGSNIVTGKYSLKDLQAMVLAWQPETSVPAAIDRYFNDYLGDTRKNFDQAALDSLQIDPADYLAALEVHIEQFTLLSDLAKENNDQACFGLMRGVGGHLRAEIELSVNQEAGLVDQPQASVVFEGEAGHTGATPMGEAYRDDALVKAAHAMTEHENLSDIIIHQQSKTSIPHKVEIQSTEGAKLIPKALVQGLSTLIISTNQSALEADRAAEIRATITMLEMAEDARSFKVFCDIRGADFAAMQNVLEQIEASVQSLDISLQTKILSTKEPVLFDSTHTTKLETLLKQDFGSRLMTGSISVPGQDIGNIADAGIASSLIFVESGTGHHPDEYVRPVAVEQALVLVKTVLEFWDKEE